MKKFCFRLIQCTWGFVQTLIGFVVFLFNIKCKHFEYKGAIVTKWNHRGGVSLGMFVFVSREEIIKHEYGHCIQSLILGPLYMFVIGIPSFVWCNVFRKYRIKNKKDYYKFYPERWANHLGR